jgi:hypothetical protein
VKFIQKPPTKIVWSWWKNGKPNNAKTNCSSYNGKDKGQKKTTKEMETRGVSISKYNGDINRQAMATNCREWRKTVLEAKMHNGLQCVRRRRKMKRKRWRKGRRWIRRMKRRRIKRRMKRSMKRRRLKGEDDENEEDEEEKEDEEKDEDGNEDEEKEEKEDKRRRMKR